LCRSIDKRVLAEYRVATPIFFAASKRRLWIAGKESSFSSLSNFAHLPPTAHQTTDPPSSPATRTFPLYLTDTWCLDLVSVSCSMQSRILQPPQPALSFSWRISLLPPAEESRNLLSSAVTVDRLLQKDPQSLCHLCRDTKSDPSRCETMGGEESSGLSA
jgi:hypothetical protein